MKKPTLISGIQPSGRLHLGNYLGALKNFVDLQGAGKYDCFFFVADYHSLTEDYNPKEKRAQILDLAASYLALGLDPSTGSGQAPKKSTIFLQSDVPASTELAWILETITPFGELRRMTQFKDKSEAQHENVNVGLFSYPVLMAADILLYNAHFVPVGEDQIQHLELTRELARRFNKRFGDTLTEPQPLMTAVPRLMSLDDPTAKMSKSRPEGCLFLDDDPARIAEKLAHAVTDSGREVKFDVANKPGISNLLLIMSALSNKQIPELERAFAGKNYSEFKRALADLVTDYFAKYREAKKSLLKSPEKILKVLAAGAKKASAIAAATMEDVKKKIGVTL